jgi:hypothetical protein
MQTPSRRSKSRMVCLPLELYRPTLEFVESPTDLCTVSRCSKIMRDEAEPLLYYHPVIKHAKQMISLLRRVSASPARGTYVFALDLVVKRWHRWILSSIFRLLSQALTRMIRLHSLNISYETVLLVAGFDPPSCGRLFNHCTFQLITFECWFTPDASLLSFLATQPHLRNLTCGWSNDKLTQNLEVPESIVPQLTVLYVHDGFEATSRFLKNRPVTHLRIFEFNYPRFFHNIPLSSGPLRALWIPYQPFEVLLSVAKNAPHLELLCGRVFRTLSVCAIYSMPNVYGG